MKPVLNITIHSLFFFFFQNNKNSLTNKDFFILSIWTFGLLDYLQKMKLIFPVLSISSPLGSRSHPGAPSPPPRRALTREYQGLLLCLCRGIQAIR